MQKSCCNPFKTEDHIRSKELQPIDIPKADRLHVLTGTLVKPGQKLCLRCRQDIPKYEAELAEKNVNPSDDADFTDDPSDKANSGLQDSDFHPFNFRESARGTQKYKQSAKFPKLRMLLQLRLQLLAVSTHLKLLTSKKSL